MKSAKFDLGQVVATPGDLKPWNALGGNHRLSSSVATYKETGVKWMTKISRPMMIR